MQVDFDLSNLPAQGELPVSRCANNGTDDRRTDKYSMTSLEIKTYLLRVMDVYKCEHWLDLWAVKSSLYAYFYVPNFMRHWESFLM